MLVMSQKQLWNDSSPLMSPDVIFWTELNVDAVSDS